MTEFNKEQALARYIELKEKRYAKFSQLPHFKRRVARGDYDFFSSVDIELDKLEQEVQQNGFIFKCNWDKNKLETVYTIEQMSQEDYAAFLAEEQEALQESQLED